MDDASSDLRQARRAVWHHPGSPGANGSLRAMAHGRSCDIVRVGGEPCLFAPAGRGRQREACAGAPLPAGYFLALRPAGARPGAPDDGVRYFGPLASREQAEWLRASARAIGLTESGACGTGPADQPAARLLQPKLPPAAP